MRFRVPTIGLDERFLPALIEQRGHRREARVHRRGRRDGVISVDVVLHAGTLLQCHIRPQGKDERWLSVLAEVTSARPKPPRRSSRSHHVVRWRRAWCRSGIPVLLRRLQWFLGCARHDFCEGFIRALHGGGFYEFPVDSGETPARPAAAGPGLGGSRQAGRQPPAFFDTNDRLHAPFRGFVGDSRIPIDHPCSYVLGQAERLAQLCEVGNRGLYVVVRETPPALGERVVVALEPLIAGRRHRVALSGVVGWSNQKPADGQPPGFGLVVQSVVDGCKGNAFQEFLSERTRGASRTVGGRAPGPAPPVPSLSLGGHDSDTGQRAALARG